RDAEDAVVDRIGAVDVLVERGLDRGRVTRGVDDRLLQVGRRRMAEVPALVVELERLFDRVVTEALLEIVKDSRRARVDRAVRVARQAVPRVGADRVGRMRVERAR